VTSTGSTTQRSLFGDLSGSTWLAVAIIVCLGARLFLCLFHGLRFHAQANWWQMLDVEWLRDHPIRALYQMHMQPPLLNGLYAVSLLLPAPLGFYLLQAIFLISSMVMVMIVYYFVHLFGVRAPIACALAILFGLLPQVLVYENTFHYSHLEAVLLLSAMFFASRYLSEQRLGSFVGLAACIAVLALVRSFFHLGWVALVLLLIWGIGSFRNGRDIRALFVAAAAILLVASVYIKNFREFGIFAASSWQGISGTVMLMPDMLDDERKFPEIRADLRKRVGHGEFSWAMAHAIDASHTWFGWSKSAVGCVESNHDPEELCALVRSDGAPNFNHRSIIEYSSALGGDAWKLLSLYPSMYIYHVASSAITFVGTPSWDYADFNRLPKQYTSVWNALLLYSPTIEYSATREPGLWSSVRNRLAAISWPLVGLILMSVAIVLGNAKADLANYCRRRATSAHWIFPALVVDLFLLLPNLVNGTESQRMRYSIEPILFLALAYGALRGVDRIRRHLRANGRRSPAT
jgi:hypothetical protein